MADLDLGDGKVDPELQEFLMLEKQKAQVNAQVKSRISRDGQKLQKLFSSRFTNSTKYAGTNASINQDQSSTAKLRHA